MFKNPVTHPEYSKSVEKLLVAYQKEVAAGGQLSGPHADRFVALIQQGKTNGIDKALLAKFKDELEALEK